VQNWGHEFGSWASNLNIATQILDHKQELFNMDSGHRGWFACPYENLI